MAQPVLISCCISGRGVLDAGGPLRHTRLFDMLAVPQGAPLARPRCITAHWLSRWLSLSVSLALPRAASLSVSLSLSQSLCLSLALFSSHYTYMYM